MVSFHGCKAFVAWSWLLNYI